MTTSMPHKPSFAASVALGAAALAFCAACEAPKPPRAKSERKSTELTQDQRMAWWREARFGMFIHWGLYAIPAGEWNGETHHGEWIRDSARIPLDQYERLQARFNPVEFNADEWARIAKEAGMRYLVITSKHHDGFALFDSKQTDWDVMGTPFRRDVLRELSEACERVGIRFCTYHSILDWHHPDYLPRRGWETRAADGADFERFERFLHAQVTEVIEHYRPGVMWFDGEWESSWSHERGLRLFDLCRSLAPAMIVNNRVDVHRGGMGGFSGSDEAVGDFATPEQEIPSTGVPGVDWETCMTMNEHWGYNAADQQWKSSEQLIHMLVDIASKGGNFLLNVGPMANGRFPQASIDRMRSIGAWMDVNAEAIHDTVASPFDPLPFGRCTMRVGPQKTKLFLHVFDWPADRELIVPGVANKPRAAYPLADKKNLLDVKRVDGGLRVKLPKNAPDPVCSVIVLELEGKPTVHRAPSIRAASDGFVRPMRVELAAAGGREDADVRYTLDGSAPSAQSPRYREPLIVEGTTTIRARTFVRDQPASPTAERTLARVAPRPATSVDVERAAGAYRRAYRGEWTALPDWSSATPERVDAVDAIALDSRIAGERIGARFSAWLDVPADDVYDFALSSDDGSRLWIDGQLVVDADGLHALLERRGSIALARGLHELEVAWFNRTGDAALELRWAPLDGELAPLDGALSRAAR